MTQQYQSACEDAARGGKEQAPSLAVFELQALAHIAQMLGTGLPVDTSVNTDPSAATAPVAARPTRAPVASAAALLRPEGSLITPHLSPSQQEARRVAHARLAATAAEQLVRADRSAMRAMQLADGSEDSRPAEMRILGATA